jgi:hypothetical protein
LKTWVRRDFPNCNSQWSPPPASVKADENQPTADETSADTLRINSSHLTNKDRI